MRSTAIRLFCFVLCCTLRAITFLHQHQNTLKNNLFCMRFACFCNLACCDCPFARSLRISSTLLYQFSNAHDLILCSVRQIILPLTVRSCCSSERSVLAFATASFHISMVITDVLFFICVVILVRKSRFRSSFAAYSCQAKRVLATHGLAHLPMTLRTLEAINFFCNNNYMPHLQC